MKKIGLMVILVFLFVLLFIVFPAGVLAESHPHWSYEGKAGPDNWGELSSDFSLCHAGKTQSPIDITHVLDAKLPPLDIVFKSTSETVVNNGHTVQVTANSEEAFPLDGDIFELVQYHFHAPGENRINGRSYPLEAHFVHVNSKGELAVLAVMFVTGKENAALNPILDAIPDETGKEAVIDKRLSLKPLFPKTHSYYRFSGSLTTPPCTEGIRWLVMSHPVSLSVKQLKKFQKALKHSNNRPLQPLNGRIIVN